MSTNENRIDASSPAGASEALLLDVYDELRRLAHYRMSRESEAQTLSATALVHEAWLRIGKDDQTGRWANRRHFFGAAAEAMRRILIDRARARNQLKRGGGTDRTEWHESQVRAPAQDAQMLAVHEALAELEDTDPESAELVKLRYFAGMTWEEIADATGVPDRSLRRRWTYAKAWLRVRIGPET